MSLRDYLTASHDADAAKRMFEAEPAYLLSESYPDENLVRLVQRASETAGVDVDALFHDFGVFTAETTFPRLYPALFAIALSAREFLLTEGTAHHYGEKATIEEPRCMRRGDERCTFEVRLSPL